jgi:hypothetical protein
MNEGGLSLRDLTESRLKEATDAAGRLAGRWGGYDLGLVLGAPAPRLPFSLIVRY